MVFIGHIKIYNWNQDKEKLILVPIFLFRVKGWLNVVKEKELAKREIKKYRKKNYDTFRIYFNYYFNPHLLGQ